MIQLHLAIPEKQEIEKRQKIRPQAAVRSKEG
jgi:hypothetical protein